ncbi:hypothetical protein ALC62_02665 [Cyphomyrmex costatus]|uniref:Uncharacterized protein n=1 Tax=Cyphomyrmex costatus TaxID=456900 RepID=A0A195D082_9HYME|nr:hypothetical protein ALC62_02665 [Cyphomyrmex costatus]
MPICLVPSYGGPRARNSALTNLGTSLASGDSLKDIPDDRLSGRANNEGDTRAGVAKARERGWGGVGRKIPQPVIRVECIIKIPRGRSASARAHTCSSAACFVSCPDDFKLRRYRRAISATAAVVPAGPG